jgi:hypothetical protein
MSNINGKVHSMNPLTPMKPGKDRILLLLSFFWAKEALFNMT